MFQKKTIDSVLAVAQGVVSDLQQLQLEHVSTFQKIQDERAAMKEVADKHWAESVRAQELATKWAELV